MHTPDFTPVRTLAERSVDQLTAHERNPRTHSKKQLAQIAVSIRRFGFLNPVLIDEQNRIIAGHGRVMAARSLGMTKVPVLTIEGMSESDRRAYVIADNRLAELTGWDDALLRLELGHILELDPDYDLAITGFDGGALEALINVATGGEKDDLVPATDVAQPVVSRLGELWILGPHRLICGDARDQKVYARLMDGALAQMVFTDPPYNVPVNGHVCGLGRIRHAEFAMASGEMSQEQFRHFLSDVLCRLAQFSVDGSIHFVCMDWRHMSDILHAGELAYSELKNLIVWNKDNGGTGSFYRSKHELVFPFKNGTGPHINNFELGQHGRYRCNVWDYAGINSLKAGRAEELAMHPTVKPVEMVADAIRDCSKRNGIILDAFSGSGTTIMAAGQTGRRGYAIELEPRYVDVAIRRWQATTGEKAMLAESNMSFADMEALVAA